MAGMWARVRQREPLQTLRGWRRLVCRYREAFGRWPNLVAPQTFNEQIIRRLLFDRDQRYRMCVDKVAVRGYVERVAGAAVLPRVLQSGTDAATYVPPTDGEPVIVKASHGSGWQLLPWQMAELNLQQQRERIARWLVQDYGSITSEWAYRGLTPYFLVEEWLGTAQLEPPDDYKIYCFGGKARLIQVDRGRFAQHERAFFTLDWQLRDIMMRGEPIRQDARQLRPPHGLAELLGLAERLAHDFDFLRVDLYALERGPVFGELTVYPNSGIGRFTPQAVDRELGQWWAAARR